MMYPKPAKGTALLERRERRASVENLDAKESAKVKVRSHGRCEVALLISVAAPQKHILVRCERKATHVHHMLGGSQRAKGPSALALHKQHVCTQCHKDITGEVGGKKLKLVGDGVPRWSDYYRRLR